MIRVRPPRLPGIAAVLAAVLAAAGAGCAIAPPEQHAASPAPAPASSAHAGDVAPPPEAGVPAQWTERNGWTARRELIVAGDPLAAQAGYEMLKAGGTAADAAIAAQMVLAVVAPQASGLGGGGLMLYADGKTVDAYDGLETAPAGASGANGSTPGAQAAAGSRAVGVPGLVRMLELAHRAHGKLAWRKLFAPAIRLAARGFPVSPELAALLARDPGLQHDPAARALFYDKDGTPKAAGAIVRNPQLAAVLRQIAAHGANAFYRGPVARAIVAGVRQDSQGPGVLGLRDLADYRAQARTPLCADYRKWTVCGAPPPATSGLAIAQLLGLVAAMPDWQQIGAQKPVAGANGIEPTPFAAHLFGNAARLAYADAARDVGDPVFVPPPGGGWTSLVAPAYLAQRARGLADASVGRAQSGAPRGVMAGLGEASAGRAPSPSGSQISVIDRYGDALTMTSSLAGPFGARIMVRGFLLNDRLADFSPARGANGRPAADRLQPGKRPTVAMAPEIVLERGTGRPMMIAGSTGGEFAADYVAKTLIGAMDWGMTMQQAIALPNLATADDGPLWLERGRVSNALVEGLEGRGHHVRLARLYSELQGIQRIDVEGQSVWFGALDPRASGTAMGD